MITTHWWKFLCTLLAAAVIGASIGRIMPPFVLDHPFWREFWSGPPAAGLFALGGAFIAYWAARLGAKTSRTAAKRQEWWDRAEWALTLARSDEDVDRIIGLEALTALSDEATKTEYALILSVIEAVSGRGVESSVSNEDMDTMLPVQDDSTKGGA